MQLRAEKTTMRHFMPLLAAAALVLSTAQAQADLGDQLFKLLADDGAEEDRFGLSVAISGATAIVGAYWDDDNGFKSGSAYLFDTTTGKQLFKLLPDDGAAGDFFGSSVAISGTTAIVGAYYDDDNGFNSGSAYLFDISNPKNPVQIAKLLANDGAERDHFGESVAISGTPSNEIAIVGAHNDDDNGNASGSAYLFDTTTGKQLFKLLPDDGAAGDFFGLSVSISGAIAIVGARDDDDNGIQSGSAYIFGTTTGRQIAKLLPDDGAQSDSFGGSVAISGTPGKEVAIVGATGDADNGYNSGAAYLFDTITGRQIAKLVARDAAKQDTFGGSVGISGSTAIVGALGNDDNGLTSGAAYLFDISDPANPTQVAKLLAHDGAEDDLFGISVAISGAIGNQTAIVGAWGDDDNGADSGSAYLFDAADASACPWDLNGDGEVGPFDLALVLGFWGPCEEPCTPEATCTTDLDGDCATGPFDLALILGFWGPCP